MTDDPKMPEPVAYASSDSRSFVSADTKRLNLGSAWAHFYDVPLITTEAAQAYAEALAAARVAQERERFVAYAQAMVNGYPGDSFAKCALETFLLLLRGAPVLHDTQPPETGKEK